MKFDNKQFETGIQTSINSLDELKKGLNLEGASRGLSDLERAGRSFSLSNISESVEKITTKFSAFSIIAITALQNLTNSVINTGKQLVSSLTIDPIKMGFREYETKMGAIQTILTNTQGGQKKVTQGAIASTRESNASAMESMKEANEESLKDLRKTNEQKLKEVQKLADNELDAVKERQEDESDALRKTQAQNLKEYQKIADEESKILDNKYEEQSKALEKSITDENKALSDAHQYKLDLYEEEYMSKLKAIDEERYNKIKAIDDEIKSINGLTKSEEEALELQKQQAKLADLQNKVNSATTSEDRLAASKELSEYQESLRRKQLLKERQDQIDNLKTSKDSIKEEYDLKKEQIKTEYIQNKDTENELYKLSSDKLKEEQDEKKDALKNTYQEEKDLLKERQTLQKDMLKEEQDEKTKALNKTHQEEVDFIKERQTLQKDILKEQQDNEIDAINKRNSAALKGIEAQRSAQAQVASDSGELTKGSNLEDVTKALDELNKYSDKTIYNFADMAKNIGTFTAAGVDLDTSVTSIKGIANLAAGSGSTTQQASTAMYQLSQALAAGSVKLQDWNSVVNAGMGGQLFQRALEKTAEELGHGRDMSVSFRESLEKGWITTEVLTKTLSKFAEDESLIKAATEVKTLTQLLDTMKESVQSGWAKTWEYIIGNKDEATKLFTTINDGFESIVGSSSDARNEMLAFWSANGGRTAIIESLSNAFIGLQSILKPIGEAFREVFPATTGQQLVDISKAIQSLTSNFKIGETTADNLKRTFKGLFAIIDIGKEALFAIVGGISDLIGYLLPVGDGLLSVTGSVGDFFVSIDEAIKKTDAFNVIIEKLGSFMKPIADAVKDSIGIIISTFASFGDVDLSGLDSFSERVDARFKPFTKMGEFIQNVFSKIADVLTELSPIFLKLADLIGGAFDKLRTNIMNALDNAEFNSIFDIVNGGLFAGILFGIREFVKSLGNVADGAGGFLNGIKGILDGVKGSLEAYQSSLKAGTLLKIASAIAILVAALVALSLIDSDKLTLALTAMTTMFVELFGSMAVFEKIMGSSGFKSMGKITRAMITLSAAILILSIAMKNLAELDWNGIAKGLVSVTVLSGVLIGTAKLLSANSGSLIKGSLGFVIFAAAINVLADAVGKLGALDTDDLIKGLVGVGVLAAELALFTKIADLDGIGVLKGIGLLALAGAISILADAVGKFAALDTGAMIQGLIGMGIVLTEIGVFITLTGDSKRVISTAVGLTILGAAMLIFAEAIGKMGQMSLAQIGKGLLAMAIALTEIAIAMKFMPKNMLVTGSALVIVASALVILSEALSKMGGMTWDEVAKGLVTLAGSLTIIAVAMSAMTGALPGAAALLIISAALAILAPVLVTLGSMSLSEIVKGLIALAGAFAVIGLAGLILGPITPIILGIAAAVALFGIGCLAVGAGMIAFAAGITALAAAATLGSAGIVLAITAILSLIPFVFKTLGDGIVEFVKAIGNGAAEIVGAIAKILVAILDKIIELTPKIVDAVIAIVNGFLKAIIEITPNIIEAAYVLLSSLLKEIVKFVPELVDAGMKIIIAFLKGIADNIGEVVKTAVDIVVNFLEAIGNEYPRIVDAGFKMVINLINGIADSIRENTPLVNDAIANLIDAMIDGFKDTIKSFFDIGGNIMKGLADGIKSTAGKVAESTKGVIDNVIDGAKSILDIHSPSKVFEWMGMNTDIGLANGMTKFSGLVTDASEGVGYNAINSLSNAMKNISDIVSGNMDMNPTIRPVLDLEDVTSGVGAMNSLFNSNRSISVDNANGKASIIASQFASGVNGISNNSSNSGSSNGNVNEILKGLNITVVSELDGRQIAKATAPAMSEELYNINRRKSLIGG
jgi:tape measure domain-containing protein